MNPVLLGKAVSRVPSKLEARIGDFLYMFSIHKPVTNKPASVVLVASKELVVFLS